MHLYKHLLGCRQSCGCQVQRYFWEQQLDDPAAMGKRRWWQVRPALVNNLVTGRPLRAASSFLWESADSRRIKQESICYGKTKHGWIAQLADPFKNSLSPRKITQFADCTRFNLVIRFRKFCSARFRGAANQNQPIHFIRFVSNKCFLASSVHFIQQTQQHLTARLLPK